MSPIMIKWNSPLLYAITTTAIFAILAACSLVDNWSLTSDCQPDVPPVVRFEGAGHLTEPPPPEPNPTTLQATNTPEAPLPEFNFQLEPRATSEPTTTTQGAN